MRTLFQSNVRRHLIANIDCYFFLISSRHEFGTFAKAAEVLKSGKILKTETTTSVAKESERTALKRVQRKKSVEISPNIWAYATAEQYDFDRLKKHLNSNTSLDNQAYKLESAGDELTQKVLRLIPNQHENNVDATKPCVIAQDLNINDPNCLRQVGHFLGEAILFKEGVSVMWNMSDAERKSLLVFIEQFQKVPVAKTLVEEEAENLTYVLNDQIEASQFKQHEILHVKAAFSSPHDDIGCSETFLEKYAISDAMCRSVKLGMREQALENLVDTLDPIVTELRRGNILVSKRDLLKKTGELFALRHDISLDSDLLDGLPDFYWDRAELEKLHRQASNVFYMERRIKVFNEKLNYCLQLGDRLDGHLFAAHSVRLERIIIFLIAVEVAFATMHFFERFC